MCEEKESKQPIVNTIPAEILQECLEIHCMRHKQYGHSEDNFTHIANIASRLSLGGDEYNALDIAILMVAIKEARYKYQYQLQNKAPEEYDEKVLHDSLIDWINYIAIMENVRIKTQTTTPNKDVENESKDT